MEQYAILLGYCDKQLIFLTKLYNEITLVDLSGYANRFLFSLRVQQFYTAIENLLKQIAKTFENHIDHMDNFHKELLARMNMEVPKIRPAVISQATLLFLDKIRAFRHFIRHAYDCELDENELLLLQKKIANEYCLFQTDLHNFCSFIQKL